MNVDAKYFKNLTSKERAIFEGGISMGALFHQFIGTPVNNDTKKTLEIAISESLNLQPAVENVEVKIDLKDNNTKFEYISLSGEMLDIVITTKIDDVVAKIRMKFIEELNYPLMYVEYVKTNP